MLLEFFCSLLFPLQKTRSAYRRLSPLDKGGPRVRSDAYPVLKSQYQLVNDHSHKNSTYYSSYELAS